MNIKPRYIGKRIWEYRLSDTGRCGSVDIEFASGNYAEDEMMARYYIRKKHDLKRIPKNSKVYPSRLA